MVRFDTLVDCRLEDLGIGINFLLSKDIGGSKACRFQDIFGMVCTGVFLA